MSQLMHSFLSLVPALRTIFEILGGQESTPPKVYFRLMARKIHNQERNQPASFYYLHGCSNSLVISPNTDCKRHSVSLGIRITSTQHAHLTWLPGEAGRQGTAQPYHFQGLVVAPPCPACQSTICLAQPFMPAVE